DRLAEADPAFISVTFGAGGSSRDRSLTWLRYILAKTDVEPRAHLTCVGSSHAEANRLVREFLDAGITRFLALRGDPPVGADPRAGIGALASARVPPTRGARPPPRAGAPRQWAPTPTPGSATSTAPPSSCSSSTACRR